MLADEAVFEFMTELAEWADRSYDPPPSALSGAPRGASPQAPDRMAKRKARTEEGLNLFTQQERVRATRARRQRALFIPKLLQQESSNVQLSGPARDHAHSILIRWADLERDGFLAQHKETSIDSRFLDEVFGEALGYAVKTQSPAAYQLEHKFSVAGVGTADGALGEFPSAPAPVAIIELKDCLTDLDRDKSSGRTAVQQCWDYLNAVAECPWAIVSNFSTIRLYHRGKGTLTYEEFTLQDLRATDRFEEFYYLLERGGLLRSTIGQPPRALALLKSTEERQQQVGDEMYEWYRAQRIGLVEFLVHRRKKDLDSAVRVAQKLLDRVIFIAFCEDRGLLPEQCLEKAYTVVPPFSRVKNPRWQNFLGLFAQVDQGDDANGTIPAFNGGLFADDPEIDALDLPDVPWANALREFGKWDFAEEISVEVLGQLFERSITELEKLRVGGLGAMKAASRGDEGSASRMPKSAQRKRFGVYYTPPAFTGLLVERTLDALIAERFEALQKRHEVDPSAREAQDPVRILAFWNACLETLKSITVCDPACGSGAFLIRAYDALDAHYRHVIHGLAGAGSPDVAALEGSVPDFILRHNLFGVDLSHEAVEITQLALWIRSARRGRTLSDLSGNVVCGNSLVDDPAVHARALDWKAAFPGVFGEGGPGGFDCVIGNPPWERVKVQEREFFSLLDAETAEAVSAADRRKHIQRMKKADPELFAAYEQALEHAQRTLDYARGGGRYPLTGKGDINTYMLFAELALRIVARDGRVGLLVPSGIATDDTTKAYFGKLMGEKRLVSLYDFENKQGHFEDVHRAFKFTALVCTGGTPNEKPVDFVFFAHGVEDVAPENKKRHIPLSAADMALLNPNTKTCPIFRTRRDADLTKAIYRRVPILIDENRKQGGNPWGIKFLRMFDQTNDAEHFQPREEWEKAKYKLRGNVFIHGKQRALPLYEAKMVQAYDHRAASVVIDDENWVRQGQKETTSPVQHQNPEFAVLPRWWVAEKQVDEVMDGLPGDRPWLLGWKDITSPTNERTMIASFIPRAAVTNKFPLLLADAKPRLQCCLLANLNSLVLDYVTRQKIGGITLNFFIVEQLPTLGPNDYADKCPWTKREKLEHWISERVLKLTCTADDMRPLAQSCEFEGSEGGGVHKWREAERLKLRAELDAAFAHLYGLSEEDFAYVLTTFPSVPEPVMTATREAYRDLANGD